MCGIVGCLALASDADPDQAWVAAATQRIAHRGPDDEGFYSDHDVALGFRRLAIIDLSRGGHQPMRSADGRYWMVFNGEIYNYVELGAELREQGVVLRSSCDSEVLLETYARVGKDVVHRLRGMFAFAIWDTQTRELFCARDQFGIKPFYYSVAPGPGADDPFQGSGAAAGGPVSGPGDASRRSVRTTGSTLVGGQREAAGTRRAETATPAWPAGFRDHRPRWPAASPARSAAPARLPGGRAVAPARRGPSGCCGSRPSARPWPTRANCAISTPTRCAGTCPSSTSHRPAP